MTVKIKVDRKTHAIECIKGNIGHTTQDRAAELLHRHAVEPTTWYKLRRFFKRLSTEISARVTLAADYHNERFDEVPYIGLEEHV